MTTTETQSINREQHKHYTYIIENKQTKLFFLNCMIGAIVVCLTYTALAKDPDIKVVNKVQYQYIDTNTCPHYDPECLLISYYELTPYPK